MSNSSQLNLQTLTYEYPIRIIHFDKISYMLYNNETSAYFYYVPSKGMCFVDDSGNHFVSGPRFLKVKTDCEDITIELGEYVYVESLRFYYRTCLPSDIIKMATDYFTIFAE